jgi:hypothetical protein
MSKGEQEPQIQRLHAITDEPMSLAELDKAMGAESTRMPASLHGCSRTVAR